jgi:hypothetical protein
MSLAIHLLFSIKFSGRDVNLVVHPSVLLSCYDVMRSMHLEMLNYKQFPSDPLRPVIVGTLREDLSCVFL